jgi:tRNA-specific A34 adenosine deaminase
MFVSAWNQLSGCFTYGCGGGSPGYSGGAGTGISSGSRWSIDYGVSGASAIGGYGYAYYGGYSYAGSPCYGYAYVPPPPPPPQDCYAGSAHTCTPPPAPRALRTTPHITSPAHDITSAASLLRGRNKIIETAPPNKNPVNGAKPNPTVNGSPPIIGGNAVDLVPPIQDLQPAPPTVSTPTATKYVQPELPFGGASASGNNQLELPLEFPETSTSGGGADSGGGGGSRVAASPCEPQSSGTSGTSPFEDLSNMRARDRIPQIYEPGGGQHTRARLDVGGESCSGRNGTEFPYRQPPNVADQAMRHAEGQAFARAAAAGISGGEADLYVDQDPCQYCTLSFRGLARSLNLEYLRVWTPQGMYGYYDIATDQFTLGEP